MPQHRSTAGRGRFWLLAAVALILELLIHIPWRPVMPRPGLDPSYRSALSQLAVDGAQFGSEVIHQYGPYGFFEFDSYHPGTFWLLAGLRVLLIVTFALLLARFVADSASRSWTGALWVVAVVSVTKFGETFFLALPLLALLVFWSAPTAGRRLRWSPVALILALASLGKFTNMVVVVLFLLLMVACAFLEGLARPLIARGARERHAVLAVVAWPALFVTGLLAWWLAAGQRLVELPAFVAGRLHLVAVYAESHTLSGPLLPALVFVASSLVFWWVVGWRQARAAGLRAIIPAVALAIVLFFTCKHSFVRFDRGHMLTGAFTGLSVTALLGPLVARRREEAPWPVSPAWSPGGIAATAMMLAASLVLLESADPDEPALKHASRLDLASRMREASKLLTDPSHLHKRNQRATKRILQRLPVPELAGTVDVYPYELSVVFARGMAYAPRPTLQSYQTASPRLSEANARAVAWPEGPDHLLFTLHPIDNRLPSLEDGRSWPHILAGYRPRGRSGGFLILDRRPAARQIAWGEGRIVELEFDESVPVDAPRDALLWASIEIDRSLRGRLFELALKPPMVYLGLELEGGGQRWFRIVPGMARAGFLLSPMVVNQQRFEDLYHEDWPERLAHLGVRAVAVETEFGRSWFFRPEIRLELRELRITD